MEPRVAHRGNPDNSSWPRPLRLYRQDMDRDRDEPELFGRDAEGAAAARWVGRLAKGPAGLLVAGEAGIGKTSLWAKAIRLASERGALVLAGRPVQAELAFGYAGLGDLLHDVAERIPQLPGPQAQALSAALSLAEPVESADPLLVPRATSTLLHLLAAEGPVVIGVDDAQWLDAPSVRALAFAARRLGDARVGLALTVRDQDADPLGLVSAMGEQCVTIRLGGLSFGAIGHLVRDRVAPDAPRRHLLRIHERSGGNPFFALELSRAGFAADGVPSTLHDLVLRRLDRAAAGRSAIELLAVLGTAPVSAFADASALDEAVAEGVLTEQQGEIRFTHPLLARGAYERIPPARRRKLHREAASSARSAEERARHRALAASGPDAEVASLLDEAATLARARGAPESAAEFAAQARRLTPAGDDESRSRRMMDEAEDLHLVGDDPAARSLANDVLTGSANGVERVRALMLRAVTASDPTAAVEDLEAAASEAHDDRRMAARAIAQLAWQRGAWQGDLGAAVDEADIALARASDLDDPPTLAVALTTAGLLRSLAGLGGAADLFRRAIAIIDRTGTVPGDHRPRVALAHERWWRGDFASSERLLGDERRAAEARGDDGLLMRLGIFEGELAMRRGAWDQAARLLEEALTDARGYWRIAALVLRAILRARRGDARARDDAEEVRGWSVPGDPGLEAAGSFAIGLLERADGRLEAAADLVAHLARPPGRTGSRSAEFAMAAPDIASIFVEAGRFDEARGLADDLASRFVQLAPWSDAAAALCRGLVSHARGRSQEALAELSLARDGFSALETPWELAETLFAQGSVLRRLGRRREAANALEQALAIQEALGAEPAAGRSREELRRARPRPRHTDTLTAAERSVAALAAQGMTNREIAGRQFVTVSTIEAHLTRIYAKLGVRSRTELMRRVSEGSVRLDP